MAKEDYKGQFKSLAKKLGPGYTVKKLREMSEKDLDKLISFEEYMDEEIAIRKGLNKGGMSMKMKKKGYAMGGMKKKGMAKGGMKKKGYAAGGLKMVKNKDGDMVPFYAADDKGKMNKGGMMKKKGMAKGGAMMKKKGMAKGGAMKKKGMAKGGAMMKKKAYAKGGRVAMYNQGGMVKSTGTMNTGIKTAKNTYK